MKILGVSGTITGSKTLIVVNRVIEEIKRKNPDVEVDVIDLKKFDVQFCDGREPSQYNVDTRNLIELVSSAKTYIFGTPIFQGSMTGALKNLIDLVPPKVFQHKIIGFAANGGNPQHSLVVENQLKPIASYLNAYVPPSFVFAHNNQFNSQNEIIDKALLMQIQNFSEQVLHMHKHLHSAVNPSVIR